MLTDLRYPLKMAEFDDYLTIAQAAAFVGVSAATLRRWDAAGTLAAVRRPGSKYRYYRIADLEPFRLEYGSAASGKDTVAGFFHDAEPSINGNARLREPQVEAHCAAMEHFATSNSPAIIQLPVGCGKTGVAALLPFGLSQQRTLVIAPNRTIREGLYADLSISNASCFWKRAGVLDSFTAGPFTALVDGPKANLDDCVNSHIVVANIQQLAGNADRWLSQFPQDFFDLVVIDEGHHNAAESWQRVIRAFPNARVVSLTATPFRADNKDLLGDVIYRYPFSLAMMNGFIKHIVSASAYPSEITFTSNGSDDTYTLEQILELNEEAWFRRGVALSDECNRHIAAKAIEKLQHLRSATGFPHQIAASAMSIDHADQVRAIFQEAGLQAEVIHSGLDNAKVAAVLAKLRNNQIDVIVQVQMLGEGFDHPPLSVAAIFRPYRSLSPYIQFVGRIMRTVEQNAPGSPNNEGFVVSHVGLNNEQQWDDFRELDRPDQEMVRGWTGGDGGVGTSSRRGVVDHNDEGSFTQRFDVPVAAGEQLSHFVNRSFIDPAEDAVIEQMLNQPGPGGITFRELGVTAEQLRARYADRSSRDESPAPEVPVQPQVQRQSLRERVASRSRTVANRVLINLGEPRAAFTIAKAMKLRPMDNAKAITVLMNREINTFVGRTPNSRADWTLDELETAYASLDEIGDELDERIAQQLEK